MLSKKMAFSLTSLITIFALAFVVTPAMAQDFDITLDMTGDISTADHLQVRHPGDELKVTLKSAKAIKLPAASVFVTTYDKMNKLVSIPTPTVDTEDASRDFVLTIEVTDAVVRVEIRIEEGIVAANPLDDTKSKVVDVKIYLVDADPTAGPQVYAIRRADNPLIKATAATLQVIITLSEKPKEFKKDHVKVTNATHGDPVPLKPIPENVVGLRQLQDTLIDTKILAKPPVPKDAKGIRGVINNAIQFSTGAGASAGDTGEEGALPKLTGLQSIRKAYADGVSGEDASELANLVALHIILDTAISMLDDTDANDADDTGTINYLNDDGDLKMLEVKNVSRPPSMASVPAAKNLDAAMQMPTTQGTMNIPSSGTPAIVIPKANFDRSKALGDYTPPNPADEKFKTQEEYNLAKSIHDLLAPADVTSPPADGPQAQRAAYKAEKAVYDAYMAIEKAIMEIEMDALVMWEQEKLVPAAAQTSVPRIPGSNPLPATGPDGMLHEYVVTITPEYPAGKPDIEVTVNEFANTDFPQALMYVPPTNAADYVEGFDKLTIQVDKETHPERPTGFKVDVPKDIHIPAGGYLIVAENKAGSAIHVPGGPTDKAAAAHERNAREMQYNVVETTELPNLETFLINGTVIDVVSPHALVITEVMWGSDESLDDPAQSQWIELYNAGAAYKTGEKADATSLIFYSPGDPLPPKTDVKDRIGTIDTSGMYWGNQLPGQRGRTGTGEAAGTLLATHPTKALISMNRVISGGVIEADGQDSMSWAAHTDPGVNFSKNAAGKRIASPGAERIITAAETAAEKQARLDKAKATADKLKAAQAESDSTGTYPMAGDGRVYISEIMFAGGGTLPQWIEIANGDRAKEFNLSGWTITVDNATADTDVSIGASAKFTIPDGTKIAPSERHDPSGDNTPSTILVVTERGRNSLDATGSKASGQVINLDEDNEVDLILAGVLTGKYTLLSDEAFLITLAPPVPDPTTPPAGETAAAKTQRQVEEKRAAALRKAATDTAGNLGKDGAAAWPLPTSKEGGRSSIIRKHVQATRGPAAQKDGMMAENWILAEDTSFADITHLRAQSYYGAANDVGTPGFRAGGALPVELSSFSPARDKATGQVMITWSTESELNNAGFFIKRSQQRDGEFQVVNATMIAGAGTTSEKQFYTYTDTTAQPNVVYYYQIEDVSLDGNRQTLTRGIRLKGHVGAAGKATVIWGELKTSHE